METEETKKKVNSVGTRYCISTYCISTSGLGELTEYMRF